MENSGTHFYHSHVATHMLDGQVGSLIVRDPPSKDPHSKLFDTDEVIIFLTDWMHELSIERFPGWYRHDIGQTAKNILINGLGNWTVSYIFCIANYLKEITNFLRNIFINL